MSSKGIRRIGARAWFAAFAVFGAVTLADGGRLAVAANPTPVQLFYVPFPENQLLLGLQTIESGGPSAAPTNPMQTYVSISAIANNTLVYYDQWENGYDADIANPANLYSGGNPGGTQVWGNGNAADGAPPGVPGDIINAGTVIVLNNPVDTTNPSAIKFDGRDKFAATKTVAVSRVGWASGSNTLLAGAVEVFDTDNWGTDHRAPVGESIADTTDFQMFSYTALAIMAGEGGATIQVDADANGIFETMQVLSEGQGFFVNGGVNVGGRVVADNPVQVDIITGDRASNYESRDSSLLPTSLWTTSYFTPVSTATSAQSITGTATTVWLYNPGAGNLTVAYTTRDGGGNLTTTNLVVPGGASGGVLKQVIPDGYGAHFTAASNFYAFSTTDSTNSTTSGGQYPNNQAWDWGFTLVPEDSLTPQVLIGLGIGRDPTSGTNPSENGNPIWVTPFGNGDTPDTIYVDYDANPLTGPLTDINGNKYNVALSLKELERAKIYDPDGNQTGVLVYTLTAGVKLAAAWGQDPLTASASAPGLDVGTGIPPLPLFSAGKNGTLDIDNDGDGFISPGDVLLYTVSIVNISRAPVPDVILQDLPPDTTYVPNSTFFTNASMVTTQIPDDGVGTPFPLDGSGVTLDNVTALPVGGAYTVTYRVQIDSFANLPPGTTAILNECSASAVGTTLECSDTTPLNGCIGDFVWKDLNGNTLQDGGAETGIGSVTIELYLDGNGNGILDGGDTLLDTETTSGGGLYLFTGVLAGQYLVNVVDATVPSGYALTTANDPTALTLAGGECNLDVDFGYQPQCVVAADCDDQTFCTDDACVANQCVYTPHVGICRPASGECDAAEFCDGAGSCPPDGLQPNGTACGSSSNTVCDNPDTCVGGACQPNNESTSVQCRADAGQCDVAEFCDGAGSCPPDGFEPNGTACGSSSNTVCDNPDTCVGGACQPNNESTSVQCRADAGQCDVAEFCDGAGSCPPDGFEPNGTACGSSSNTVCDNPDTCVGGACQPNNESTSVQCRADAGQCDVAEFCDGAGSCPPDGFEPNGTACGSSSNTVCDNPDTCVGGACQPNNESTSVQCRADAGQCDVAEFCDGAGSCPPDGFEPNGTACGSSSNTVCDNPDTCVGGACQPNNESTSVQCRADAGQCDVAEFCDGAGSCPPDGFEPNGTACGSSSNTVCDNPDTCVGGACQPNNESTSVQCRADAGQCDVAEFCDGAGSCPPDGFEPNGTACGSSSNTVCDNPDTCVGGACQPNNESTSVQCRADAGQCDVAEFCDGAGSCPPDGFEPNGTACGSSSNTVCDNPDTCVGGMCQSNNEPNTTVCRPDVGPCDAAELCDGAGNCPPDVSDPDGTPCEDGDACTSVDTIPGNPDACEDGECVGIPVDCDDDETCTDDSCDSVLGCMNVRDPANGPTCGDDHYKCYKTRPVPFVQRDVSLMDQFGPSTARVLKVDRFCNPANKNDEGILDPTAHLNCYKIREPGFQQRDVVLTNQFGEQRVTVVRPDSLCLPAVKDMVGELDDLEVNHFKCYKVRPATPYQSIPGVSVIDQFEDKDTTIIKPQLLCTPANKNGEDPTAPMDLGHLTCFKIRDARGQTPFSETGADVEDQFVEQDLQGTQRTDCRRSKLLCVPSLKRLASPSGAFLEETSALFD